MIRPLPTLLTALLTFLVALPILAAPKQMRVDAGEYPWSAIGRLNYGGRGWCSAVLIAPSHILTAGHCLWNPIAKDWWPLSSLHFVAAHQGDEISINSDVTATFRADLFRDAGPLPVSPVATDWAIVELAQPLGLKAGWLTVAQSAGKDGLIGHVGYRVERGHAMTLDYGCRLGPFLDDMRVLTDDCLEVAGDSGGPLLLFLEDGPHVIGITDIAVRGEGVGLTESASIVALGDKAHFPKAAGKIEAILLAAQHGTPPQDADGARKNPGATIRALDPASTDGQDLATLTRLLNRAAREP